MPGILIATESDAVNDEVEAALAGPGTTLWRVRRGVDVRPAVAEHRPDLVVVDLQIGNMGGMAVCMDLRHETAAGRLDPVRVLMLLDREADVFLARRSEADGWLVKPIDGFRVRRAATALLGGGTYHEGWDDESAGQHAVATPNAG